MLRIFVSKLLQIIPVLILVSIGAFGLLQLVPGDPAAAVLGPDAQPQQLAALRQELGLNRPLLEQFGGWFHNIIRGDFGTSVFPPHQSVGHVLLQRIPVTLEIALLSLVISLIISLPIALATAYRPGGRLDRVLTGLTFGAISVPSFLGGLLIVFFFVFHPGLVQVAVALGGLAAAGWTVHITLKRAAEADEALAYYQSDDGDDPPDIVDPSWTAGGVALRAKKVDMTKLAGGRARTLRMGAVVVLGILVFTAWLVWSWPNFPRQGFVRISDGGLRENLRSIALPVMTLAIAEIAVFSRLLRSDLITTLGEDYIHAAKAKGMPVWRILTGDALRPSCFSLITVISVTIGRVIGGTVIVETIFNEPGMGRLVVEAIARKDFPIVQAAVLLIAVVYVIASALVDIAYYYLDPRIRRGKI